MRCGIAAVVVVALSSACGVAEDFFATEDPTEDEAAPQADADADVMPAASPASAAPDASTVETVASADVVFVAIDEATYATADGLVSELDGAPIGRASGDNAERFRELHARLIEALDRAQPRLVVLDVAFGATMDGSASEQLGAVLALADTPVVLAAQLDPLWTGHAAIYDEHPTGHAEFVRRVESHSTGMLVRTDAGLPLHDFDGEALSRPPLSSVAYAALVGEAAGSEVTACVTETYATSATLLGNADDLRLVLPARRGDDDLRRISGATLLESDAAQRSDDAEGGDSDPLDHGHDADTLDLQDAVVVIGFDVPGVDRHELEAHGEYIARAYGHAWSLRSLLRSGPDCIDAAL